MVELGKLAAVNCQLFNLIQDVVVSFVEVDHANRCGRGLAEHLRAL